jgi:hypothetical protein
VDDIPRQASLMEGRLSVLGNWLGDRALGLIGLGYVHVAWCIVGHTVRDTAKNSSEPAHAFTSHDDQEGVLSFRLLDKHLGGRAAVTE